MLERELYLGMRLVRTDISDNPRIKKGGLYYVIGLDPLRISEKRGGAPVLNRDGTRPFTASARCFEPARSSGNRKLLLC